MYQTQEQQPPLPYSGNATQAMVCSLVRENARLKQALEQQIQLTAQAREEANLYQRELAEENAKLVALATMDSLTGLKNRRAFEERLREEFQRAVRGGTPVSVIMLDVDRFKQYNDMHGHVAGDAVLKKIAELLNENIREEDLAARYGGEEFVIVMEADKERALATAERLRSVIEQTQWPKREVTASLGVSTMTKQMARYAVCDLVAEADQALYYSKSRCRNRVSHILDVSANEAEERQFTAINVGGGDVLETVFAADAYYQGGLSAVYTDPQIKTSGVLRPAPEAVYMSERYGDFSYTVPNLQAGGCFLLRLHFVEIYWLDAGRRLFDVIINNAPVLTNYDIVADCGCPHQVVVKEFPAIADKSGNIVIQCRTILDNAKLSAIEVVPVLYNNSYSINCGGGSCSPFVRDNHYHGGTIGGPNADLTGWRHGDNRRHLPYDLSGVTGNVPEDVYHLDRWGDFNYLIPDLPPGVPCLVRLHFAESVRYEIGGRVFHAAVNDERVLTDFDIVAEAGGVSKAITRSFPTLTRADGTVLIEFVTVVDNAQVNAIEVFWRT